MRILETFLEETSETVDSNPLCKFEFSHSELFYNWIQILRFRNTGSWMWCLGYRNVFWFATTLLRPIRGDQAGGKIPQLSSRLVRPIHQYDLPTNWVLIFSFLYFFFRIWLVFSYFIIQSVSTRSTVSDLGNIRSPAENLYIHAESWQFSLYEDISQKLYKH